ncbi:DAK2 domain-containing protein [Kineosporia sp. J2-2]|uniref:DAK2 domain-containing protein n=1 Tax=Kineosporia corallincola TaxID=2835133 RepID=A0ABS5TFD3_9ACTN|nr:DAK2 domain-containing protein [Kineosporia corallincola]MBT0769776.1 DAK2 domain-containing protein [Kineosporia corallincola]
MLNVLDPPAARRWALTALGALADAREEIDALNVFPVPDGDTGTNMYLTLEAAVAAAQTLPPHAPVAEVADAFARGALLGARGNSGVIGAQLLRGWAQVLATHSELTTRTAVECFRRADEQAWKAVHLPVEGTMLSVSRAAALAAREAAGPDCDGDLDTVISAAAEAARLALARTPVQLPALAAAGVVDAGGRGLVVLLDTLAEVVLAGRHPHRRHRQHRRRRPANLPALDFAACLGPVPVAPATPAIGVPVLRRGAGDRHGRRTGGPSGPGAHDRSHPATGPAATPPLSLGHCAHAEAPEPGQDEVFAVPTRPGPQLYEVMFLLDTDPERGDALVDELRTGLDRLGDSLVIVGGPDLWQVHVHVEDAGAAVERALGAGHPHRIRITHLGPGAPGPAPAESRTRTNGLVACAAGPGLAALFESTGATVVAGGPGRRPSTAAVLAAIRRTGASDVAVLPNDADTLSVARIAAASARTEGVRVTVVPTRAQVQGLAAAAVHDPHRRFDDDVVSMSAAAGGARDGAVTVAARNGLTSAGECRIGDALGVVDGDFAVLGDDLTAVAVEVLDRLLASGGELVTIVVGAGGHDALARSVAAHARGLGRGLEVNVVDGGQPRYPLLIGVE